MSTTTSNGDIYIDAARELSQRSQDPRQDALDADRDTERAAADLGRDDIQPADDGIDENDSPAETGRAGE